LGDDADRLLNTMAGIAADYTHETRHDFRHRAADVIAVAIQKGHAMLVERALMHIGYAAVQSREEVSSVGAAV
jgi:hypothetical protein